MECGMAEQGYTFEDLIAAAGSAEGVDLSERTTNQYIAEGLLPQPRVSRNSAIYTEEHLLLLRLTVRLAAQYVPLKDIARCLDRLNPAQVRALLVRQSLPRLPSEGDAQAYLHRLLRSLPQSLVANQTSGVLDAYLPKKAKEVARTISIVPTPAPSTPLLPQAPAERSDWVRITVHPDVEVMVRAKSSAASRQTLDHIVEAIQAALER